MERGLPKSVLEKEGPPKNTVFGREGQFPKTAGRRGSRKEQGFRESKTL